jgi:adenylate cyclase
MVMDVADWDHRVSDSGEALVHRLRRWAEEAHWQLLSFHKGRIVKRMNNGLMMEFADARSCLQAAFALGELADSRANTSNRLRLRAGAHLANYSLGQDELVGPDVRLTSGLTALAKPGEVLVTAALRNRLADGLHADFEDLGYRRVKPFTQPVRLFRASSSQEDVSDWKMVAHHDLRPGLAVIPFEGGILAKHWTIGELIAEGVIGRLSHSIGMRVISRQSTSALRDRGGLGEIERQLGATFVLSGSYGIRGKKLIVRAELAEARSHTLLWSGQLEHAVDDLLQEDSELLYKLACMVAQTLGKAQVRKPLAQPLPQLDSNILLQTGISMTHSHSAKAYERGRKALTELTVRHPGLALPRAWLGMCMR